MSFDVKLDENNDFVIASDGDISKVEKVEKLEQDITKGLSTTQGTNQLHPEYGLPELIGLPITMDDEIISNKINNAITQLIFFIQNVQEVQRRTQLVEPEELALVVKSILSQRDTEDPRQFNCYVEVLSEQITKGASIMFSIVI
jgi:hypothetical protein